MESLLETIGSNPLYLLAGVALLIFIVFSLIKKVFKLAMFLFLVLIAYGAYLFMTQDDPVEHIKGQIEAGKSAVKKVEQARDDLKDDAVKKVVDEVKEQLEEAAKKK